MMKRLITAAERTKRRNIMDQITHFDPAITHVAKEVLVMPKAIRPLTLFIREIMWLADLNNFRQPRHRDAEDRRDRITNHQSRINFSGNSLRMRKFSDGGVILARLRGSEKKFQQSVSDIRTVCVRAKV